MKILIAMCLVVATVWGQTPADERLQDDFDKVMDLMKAGDGEQLDEEAAKARAQRFRAALDALLTRWQPKESTLDMGRLTLGRAYTLAGRPAEAIPNFRAFIESHPNSADTEEAIISLGTAYLDGRDWGNAGRVLSEFLTSRPSSDRAHVAEYYLAIARHQQGALDESISRLDRVAGSGRESPLIADASIKAIEFLRDGGRVEEARVRLEKLRSEHSEAPYLDALNEQLNWIGKPAPEFIGLDSWVNGEGTSIKESTGRVLVINFFADKYDACRLELEALQLMSQDLSAQGVGFLGLTKFYRPLEKVSKDAQLKNLETFLAKRGVTFPVGVAQDFANLKAYGVRGIPHTVVVDKSGVIAHVKVGSSRRNERALADLANAIKRAL